MKFVRQLDTSQTYTNENNEECIIAPCYIEDPIIDFWLGVCKKRDVAMLVEDTNTTFFDPGGMLIKNEPEIWIEPNNQRMGCWLRSAESLYRKLKKPGTWANHISHGPKHVFIPGAYKDIILTPETALLASQQFEQEWRARVDEADDLHAQRAQLIADLGMIDGQELKNHTH